MTLESSLPYVSLAAALAAGVVVGRRAPSSAEPGLKALALAALAMFAYFRGVAPAAIAQALVLSAIAQALLPRGAERFGTAGTLFLAGAWLVFGYLFLKTGGGFTAAVAEPVRAVLLVALLAGVAACARRVPRRSPRVRAGALADLLAAGLAAGAAITLPWSAWPAMAGALGVLSGEALLQGTARPEGPAEGPLDHDVIDSKHLERDTRGKPVSTFPHPALARRLAWTLGYLGQAAMAYPFLR